MFLILLSKVNIGQYSKYTNMVYVTSPLHEINELQSKNVMQLANKLISNVKLNLKKYKKYKFIVASRTITTICVAAPFAFVYLLFIFNSV